jgi:CRISPR-associated endonuclease/helicase Cas3
MEKELPAAKLKVVVYPAGIVLTAWVEPRFFRQDEEDDEEDDDTTDADDTSSLHAGLRPAAPIGLERHCQGVARWARSFASRLGVEEDLLAVLERAACLRDLGKADWRFQYLLYGDEPREPLLAKSGRDWDARQQKKVYDRFGLPRGFRHEFVSAALVRNHRELLLGDLNDGQRQLAEYLVGTHHGRGRPFVPVIQGPSEEVALRWDGHALRADADHGLWRLDSGWADAFWGLVRCWGYWGLAYLEALLRLADGACSAEEQRLGRERT